MFGSGISEADSFRLLDGYQQLGGNFLDTSRVFADWIPGVKGASEKTIGKWLQSRDLKEKIIVGTKGGDYDNSQFSKQSFSPKEIEESINTSLERLGLNKLDLFYLHRDYPDVPVGEIMDVLATFVRQEKVRWIAASNWTKERLGESLQYSRAHQLPSFCANQIGWSLAKIKDPKRIAPGRVYMDDSIFEFHQESGIPVIAYSSQASGFFAGKYGERKLNQLDPSDKWVFDYYYSPENFELFRRAETLSGKLSVSVNAVALAYLWSQSFPGVAIIGSRTIEQLLDSCRAASLKLNPKQVSYLQKPVMSLGTRVRKLLGIGKNVQA